jgi:hypothetical protein
VASNLPEATFFTLDNYVGPNIYADVVAEQAEPVESTLTDFL